MFVTLRFLHVSITFSSSKQPEMTDLITEIPEVGAQLSEWLANTALEGMTMNYVQVWRNSLFHCSRMK